METIKEFIEDCISTGMCVENDFGISKQDELEIEDILDICNDKTARTKIRKILKKYEIRQN